MAKVRIPQNNFERGEISPSMVMRTDLNTYINGAEEVRNLFLLAEGGVKRRAGTEHIHTFTTITPTTETFTITVTDYSNIAVGSTIKFSKQDGTEMTIEFETAGGSSPSASVGNTHYVRSNESNDTVADNLYTAINAISGFTVTNPSANVVTVTRDAYGIANQTVTSSDATRLACTNFSGTPRVQVRLEPFVFSDDERYVIAFSNARLDIFRINASTGVVSLATSLTADSGASALPWTTARLERLTITQNADVMFVAHPDFMIRKITRTALTTFQVDTFAFDATTSDDEKYQPYFSFQSSGVTLTPQATSGTGKTMTTSAAYWNSAHVGTIIRYNGNEVLITGYTSATVVTGTVRKTLSATTATTNWDEASFSAHRGYPNAITFHEDRLWLGGTTSQPDAVWASKTGEYFNFDVASAGDSDSIQVTINIGEFNNIRHLVSSRDLQIFTSSSEIYIPSFADKALTPTNTRIRRQTPYGASYVKPLPFDGGTIYVQNTGTSVREFVFTDEESAYTSTPLSLISSHLISSPTHITTSKGAFSRPEQYAFIVNDDGTLAIFHSIRSEKKAGWVKWTTTGHYHSVCAIDDRVFTVACRDMGGSTNKFTFEEFKTSLRLDCSDEFTATSSNSGIFTTNTIYTNGASLAVVEGDNYIGAFTMATNQINVSATKTINKAEIGLSFASSLKTLPIDAQMQGGPLTGEPRAITRVNLDLLSTFSVSVNTIPLIIQGVTDTVSDSEMPFTAFTGKKEFRLLGFSTDPRVEITQTAPLDLQINGMVVEVAF